MELQLNSGIYATGVNVDDVGRRSKTRSFIFFFIICLLLLCYMA